MDLINRKLIFRFHLLIRFWFEVNINRAGCCTRGRLTDTETELSGELGIQLAKIKGNEIGKG